MLEGDLPGEPTDPPARVQLRSAAYHPHIYDRMIEGVTPGLRPGEIVAVYDRDGKRFGSAFYNPSSRIRLRMLAFDDRPIDEAHFRGLFERAVNLRRSLLDLDPDQTTCCRLFHAEGDGLSGLIVDRFDDILSFEIFSLGVYRQLDVIVPLWLEITGATSSRVHVDALVGEREGFTAELRRSPPESTAPPAVRVRENGLRYAIDFEAGHKTGFFCDQRENRARLARWVGERSLLDLCCYTGGFSISARAAGSPDVTGVDLDEKAIEQARHNANLNQLRIKWVHSDAFIYARQMQEIDRRWGAVVLDPPKFIPTRASQEEGRRKYFDLNRLAVSLVEPGGLFVTCSCSGLLAPSEFEKTVIDSAHRIRRSLQWLDTTGAGPDHPVASNCPEGRYLKVTWWRVLD